MQKTTIPLGLVLATGLAIPVYAGSPAGLTPEAYQRLYAPEGLPACLWINENRATLRQQGIASELWKRLYATCLDAQTAANQIGKEHGYDQLTRERDTNLLAFSDAAARYQQTVSDWKTREQQLVEKIKTDCGQPCANVPALSEEVIHVAQQETLGGFLQAFGLEVTP